MTIIRSLRADHRQAERAERPDDSPDTSEKGLSLGDAAPDERVEDAQAVIQVLASAQTHRENERLIRRALDTTPPESTDPKRLKAIRQRLEDGYYTSEQMAERVAGTLARVLRDAEEE